METYTRSVQESYTPNSETPINKIRWNLFFGHIIGIHTSHLPQIHFYKVPKAHLSLNDFPECFESAPTSLFPIVSGDSWKSNRWLIIPRSSVFWDRPYQWRRSRLRSSCIFFGPPMTFYSTDGFGYPTSGDDGFLEDERSGGHRPSSRRITTWHWVWGSPTTRPFIPNVQRSGRLGLSSYYPD